MTQSTVILKLS